jgi:hypothetical protein
VIFTLQIQTASQMRSYQIKRFLLRFADFSEILPEAGHHKTPKCGTDNNTGWLRELMAGRPKGDRNNAGT